MKDGDRAGDTTTVVNAKQRSDKSLGSGNVNRNSDDNKPDVILNGPRVFRNATSFVCVILIIIGELMNEQNLWAVLLLGGFLGVLNVIFTSVSVDQIRSKDGNEYGSMASIAGTGSSVRFSDTLNTPIGSRVEPQPATVDMKAVDESRRKRQKRRSRSRYNRVEEVQLPPHAISIEIEKDESELDSDSSVECDYDDDEGRRRRGRENVQRKRPRGGGETERRQRPSSGIREKGILKRKGGDADEKRKKERSKERERDRERRDRKERGRSRKKKRKRREQPPEPPEYYPRSYLPI